LSRARRREVSGCRPQRACQEWDVRFIRWTFRRDGRPLGRRYWFGRGGSSEGSHGRCQAAASARGVSRPGTEGCEAWLKVDWCLLSSQPERQDQAKLSSSAGVNNQQSEGQEQGRGRASKDQRTVFCSIPERWIVTSREVASNPSAGKAVNTRSIRQEPSSALGAERECVEARISTCSSRKRWRSRACGVCSTTRRQECTNRVQSALDLLKQITSGPRADG
jgi:hypothetical protein